MINVISSVLHAVALTQGQLFWLIVGIVSLGILIGIGVLEYKNKKLVKKTEKQEEQIEQLKQKLDTAVEGFVLPRGIIYTVNKADEQITPGSWQVVSGVEGVDNFNFRHNGFVRNVKSGTILTFAEGDTIGAVSANVVVRLPQEK
ncbi:MAG: hypothetical protein J6R37_00570 [Clostridia bacterium]|nr:hypothetical protein [Clostridia bacterium]